MGEGLGWQISTFGLEDPFTHLQSIEVPKQLLFM